MLIGKEREVTEKKDGKSERIQTPIIIIVLLLLLLLLLLLHTLKNCVTSRWCLRERAGRPSGEVRKMEGDRKSAATGSPNQRARRESTEENAEEEVDVDEDEDDDDGRGHDGNSAPSSNTEQTEAKQENNSRR